MHPTVDPEFQPNSQDFLTFSAEFLLSLKVHDSPHQEIMMKAEQNLSTIFRQLRPLRPLRPALRQPHPATSPPHPFSQLAPLRNLVSCSPPSTPKRDVPRTSSTVRSLQSRRVSDSASALPQAVAHLPDDHGNTQSTIENPPAYEITFTCKPCKHRSTHTISKHGYHKGSILIACPECSNRHVISDHLKVGFQPLSMLDAKVQGLKAMGTDKLENRSLETNHSPSRI